MNKPKQLVLTLIFTLSSVSGYSQYKDSTSIQLPVMNYSAPQKYHLKDIKITGAKQINPELIINSSGLRRGDSVYIPSEYISKAIQLLWAQRYYSNVKALVEIDGEDAFLEIILQERPRVSVWEFNGVNKSQKKEIEDRLKLNKRNELSEYALNNSKDIISRYFAEKGYLYPEIIITQRNDSLLNNFVIVTFNIDRKEKVKIQNVDIEGNVNLLEKKLKASMKKTRERSLINILKSAKFSEKEFKNSKVELIDYMQSKGYRDAAVISDSIYKINDKRLGIKMKVYEGDKYYFRNISWIGNAKYTTEQLDRILAIKKGDTYDIKNLRARLGNDGGQSAMEGELTVSSLYQNDGHLAFSADPVETVVEGDSIDIEVRIIEGKQFTVNDVVISGNNRTNDRVVRRELYMRPGELYDQSMLINSIRLIGSMQHFDPEKAVPDIQPVSDQLVDIKFNLVEKPSDQFEISGGWGGGMFVVSAGVTFNNVSLRKAFEKHAWRPYPSGDNQQLKLSIQSNGTYYQAFSFSFLEPWLGGKKPNSLSLSAYYSSENDAMYAWQRSDKRFKTIGVSAGLGKRLAWPDPYFQIMGQLSYQTYLLRNWDYFMIKDGTCNTVALTGTISRNSMDQQIYPRRGSEMFFKLAVTPPWSLMNKKKDWSDPKMPNSERYKWIEYYKINAMARFFIPMLPNNKLVLMTKAEFGFLGDYNPNNPSPFEGFTMGGDGVSGYNLYGIQDIGLRGYDDGDLTPLARNGQQARVYSKYVAELRYPIVLQPSSTVYALVFAEAGNAAMSWRKYNPFDLKRSVGVGLRLHLPIIGMFGIDWGYGFDKVNGGNKASGGQFHFSIGQTF